MYILKEYIYSYIFFFLILLCLYMLDYVNILMIGVNVIMTALLTAAIGKILLMEQKPVFNIFITVKLNIFV